MRKITFLLAFISMSAFAQQGKNYLTHPPTPSTTNNEATATITRVDNGKKSTVQTFNEITDFFIGLNGCEDIAVKSENFEDAPDDIVNCGISISSSGDECYEPQVLETGFSITASPFIDDNGNEDLNTVSIGQTIIGNNKAPLVGSFNFENFTIINFQEAPSFPYAVAFDIFTNESPSAIIRVFNTDNKLVETLTVETILSTETFFGFLMDEPVGKLEVEGADESGELIGNLIFGANCGNILSTQDSELAATKIYPNPVKDLLTIDTPSNLIIEEVSLIDITGKNTKINMINKTLDIRNLAGGIYLLKIKTSSGLKVLKVVKQ